MKKERPPRNCAGTGLAKGFGCGEPLNYFLRNGLRVYHSEKGLCKKKCYPEWLTETDAGKVVMAKAMIKGSAVVAREIKKTDKEQKAKMKSNVTNWKDVLQRHVNKISRLIDKDLLCLARNQKGKMHAGHVFARGGNQTMRYKLHNIHRQSAQSNKWQNDDGLLREGITKEYGQYYMDFIASLRRTPQLQLKPHEYKNMSAKASKIALRLEKADLQYSVLQRIELRNQINIELGIYQNEFCVFDAITNL